MTNQREDKAVTEQNDERTAEERYEAGAERARRWYDRTGLAGRPTDKKEQGK